MRKLLSIFSIALVAMFALGCDDANTDKPNGNNGVTINFGEPTVTSTSIEVGIVPADAQKNYFAGIVAAKDIESMDDATIITEYIQKLEMKKGAIFIKAEKLTPETDYTAIAFYMGDTDKVAKLNIRTVARDEVDEPFSVVLKATNITHNSVIVTATPNKTNENYFFRIVTAQELRVSNLTTPKQIMEFYYADPAHEDYIGKGDRTIEDKKLASKFEYVAIAFSSDAFVDMMSGLAPIEFFYVEFTTEDAPEVDPDTLFLYENLEVGASSFILDVTPVRGDDQLWSFYIFEKRYYNEYLEYGRNNVVMYAYSGLYGLRQEYSILNGISPWLTFNEFMTNTEYMGHYGSQQITSYEMLEPLSEYVVVMFYVDPEVKDFTTIADYNFVAVEFTTKEPDENLKVKMEVLGPVIEKAADGQTWDVSFNISVDDNAISLVHGSVSWETAEPYWDPADPGQIRDLVDKRSADLEAAKSKDGVTLKYTGATASSNVVFFFEARNLDNNPTTFAVRVTPEMFE